MRKFDLLAALALGWATLGNAGSVGGGTPAVRLESAELMALREGAMNGDVIRYTEFGADPVYMVPQKETIRPRSLRAFSLNKNTSTRFYAPSDAENLQSEFSRSVVRSMALPGTLPLLESDLAPQIKPKVEIVPASELERQQSSSGIED
jgi:hypothetical protein